MPRTIRSLVFLIVSAGLAACSTVQSTTFKGTALSAAPASDFTLTDQGGAPWTLSQQRGRVVALYFGFTHCTDTCPVAVAKIAKAIAQAHGTPQTAEIAFVTVDPKRDTPAALTAFIKQFEGARVVGLTGTPEQIAAVERAYHIWAQKMPPMHGSSGYDVSHSSSFYLIDRNGNLRVMHGDDDSLASLRSDIGTLLQ